jgi:hypothetical protein
VVAQLERRVDPAQRLEAGAVAADLDVVNDEAIEMEKARA